MKNLFIVISSLLLFAYSANGQIKNVDVDAFKKEVSTLEENEVLLDVRSKQEVKAGYIEGMMNIDFYSDDFEAEIDKLDKAKTYYVYCAAGGRSMKAANMMEEKGFKNLYNLNGGITAWKNSGNTVKE